VVALVSANGCAPRENVSQTASPGATTDTSLPPPKTLTLKSASNVKLVPGGEIIATAEGLPPDQTVDLVWGTVNGGWVVEDYYRFRGKKFTNANQTLKQATVGADGRVSVRFDVPEDYGGVHEVFLSRNSVPLAQGAVEVGQTFEIRPSEGPVGTPIEIRVTGLGWRTMESTWVVNWDNQEIGWVSAAGTRGSAVARFRAAGQIGEHQVKIYTGYMGQGYLNHEQAPNSYLPRPDFVFRITPGELPASAFAEPYQKQPVPADAASAGSAQLSISPTQGPVQTRARLAGRGLTPDARLSLVWETQAGNRVSGGGFAPTERDIMQVTVGPDGRIDVPIVVPDDLGGLHGMSLRSGETVVAKTYFVIETSIVSMSPMSGPAGTPVTIHLKGVGWTDYDNIYVATYDNAYMGYACGFNSQGDVVINFKAAGAPVLHLIVLYPGIYQGPEGGQQLYRLPQLTYADDHPGNRIPALRFAFRVDAASESTSTRR
jgi:hypothetical protein